MNSVDQSNHTYYSCEDLFLDYLDKLNQSFAQQFSDYLKDAYSNNKKEIIEKKIIIKIEPMI